MKLFIPRKDYFKAGDDQSKSAAEMANYMAIERWAQDFVAKLIPSGTVLMTGSSTAPTLFVLCDGTSYLRSAYPDLYAAIGTTFGAVDGAHFNVPNFIDHLPIGAGGTVALGAIGGTITNTHTHAFGAGVNTFGETLNHTHTGVTAGGASTAGVSNDHAHSLAGITTGGPSQTYPLPALGINYIIKV